MSKILLGEKFSGAAPGANTNIFGATELVPRVNGELHITVRLATASVLNIVEDSTVIGLNRSVALQAGDGYCFTWQAMRGRAYNFQVETDGLISKLAVELEPYQNG